MRKNKGIIILFDLDGTLIDSTDAIVGCFYNSFDELNFDFKGDVEDIKKEIGYPLDVMYETLGVPKEKISEFVKSYKKKYLTIFKEQTTLLPDAYEAVVEASTFARLGIVTTKTTTFTVQLLESFGICKYFETIVGRQEVTNPKPHPEPVLTAQKNMNATTNDVVYMIGDTKLDLIAAQEAGVQGVGVLCGYGDKKELSKYTDKIYLTSLEAIKELKING